MDLSVQLASVQSSANELETAMAFYNAAQEALNQAARRLTVAKSGLNSAIDSVNSAIKTAANAKTLTPSPVTING